MTIDAFTWKDEYSVGIQVLDEQHKVFFQMANKVLDFSNAESKATQKRETLLDIVNDLANYALYHLSTEEEYFNQFHYEGAVSHIKAHDEYRSVIKDLFNSVRQEGADATHLARKAAQYSGDWLVHHILVMDKGYTKNFIDHGINN